MAWWLKAVPWSVIIANTPALVDSARKLLDKHRGGSSAVRPAPEQEDGSAGQRIAELESRQRKMLELIESLASSNQQMMEAIVWLRSRARIQFAISIMLGFGLIVALLGAFSR